MGISGDVFILLAIVHDAINCSTNIIINQLKQLKMVCYSREAYRRGDPGGEKLLLPYPVLLPPIYILIAALKTQPTCSNFAVQFVRISIITRPCNHFDSLPDIYCLTFHDLCYNLHKKVYNFNRSKPECFF